MTKRQRVALTDDWHQLRLYVGFPEQETYELLRPIVLFGQTAAERAAATGVSERTLDRKADRFDAEGMASLFPTTEHSPDDRRRVPADIRHRILALKAEYPAFRPHEIAEICRRRDDCRVSHMTVQRILADGPLPTLAQRRYPLYRQIAEPQQRRLAIVHLYFDGWNIKSIAGYLETTRPRVYETMHRFFTEGFAGMPDKSHAPHEPVRKADFQALAAIRRLQANADLGEFRIHAKLRQMGIHLSPSTCGRIMARNRKLYGLAKPARAPHTKTPQPFAATRRHQYWSVDIRHLDMANIGMKVYCVSILENYSRAILASGLFPAQDLSAYLMILYAAIRQHGVPETLVSDSGAVFVTAKQAKVIYAALGIEKREIERGKPWQNYIESTFKIQRRMADWHFAKATTWAELLAVHDQWVVNLNYQVHWAHQERDDDRRSPRDVLGRYTGRQVSPEELHRLFYRTRFGRKLDRLGYVRFRHWRAYGERGLGRERAAVWLYGETLTLEYADEPLAQYRVRYEPDKAHLLAVEEPLLFETPYQSPQLPLWELNDAEWLKVIRRPDYAPRAARREAVAQPALFAPEVG